MAPTLDLRGLSWPSSLCEAVKQVAGLLPTATVPQPLSDLRVRQAPAATVTVTSNGGNGGNGGNGNNNNSSDLSGGSIAGIVIGSVVGFLLLLWIVRSCSNLGAPPQERESWYNDVEPRRSSYDRHHHHHRHHSHSRSRSRPEVAVVSPVITRDERRRSREYGGSRSPRRPEGVYVVDSRGRSGKYYGSS